MVEAASWFNAGGGLASDKLGAASAGHLFEKIFLRMTKTIQQRSEEEEEGGSFGEIALPHM